MVFFGRAQLDVLRGEIDEGTRALPGVGRARAGAELQQALDEHLFGWIADLGVDPRLAPVADDPRFSAIVRAAGLRN